MKAELQEKTAKVVENLGILPLNTKAGKDKYLDYANTEASKYKYYLELVKKEIDRRYGIITSVKANPQYAEAMEKKFNLDIICFKDNRIPSYNKMGLDEMIYKLDHFYKDSLSEVNNTMLAILAKFDEVGVRLTINDFNYSTFVTEYMRALLQHRNNSDAMQNVLDVIYWQCPEIIIHVELNFLQIYFKHEKQINNYYDKKFAHNNNLNDYQKMYNDNLRVINTLNHTDNKVLLDKFINKELSVSDFSATTIDKLKTTIIGDGSIEENYTNLNKLLDNLYEYKNYLIYTPVIDKLRELYKDKASYKGLYDAKLKEIQKKEGELVKLNKKLVPSLFNKPSKEKIGEIQLQVSTKIAEIRTLYNELKSLNIKNLIFKNVADDTSIHEILLLAACDYDFIVDSYHSFDETMSIDTINSNLTKLKEFIYMDSLSIISNLSIINEKDVNVILVDRYKLMNIDINVDSLTTDTIDTLISNVNHLLISHDLVRNNFNLDDISFVLEVDKKVKKV